MRRAGAIVGDCLAMLRERALPGTPLADLASLADAMIRGRGAMPTFLGYHGYPAPICISVNEEAVHGLPGRRRLRDGDVVSFDVGATLHGWVADAAISVVVGGGHARDHHLVATADLALRAGIEAARADATVGDVGAAIERTVITAGLRVVQSYCGHGVGRSLHEDPVVPNVGPGMAGPALAVGSTIAIEPVISAGSGLVALAPDGWTVKSLDHGRCAHAEMTIAVTAEGPLLLTLTSDERWP